MKILINNKEQDNIKAILVIKFVEQSVEELAEKEFPLLDTTNDRTGEIEEENYQLLGHKRTYIKGYNQAKSSDKKWSDEDMINFACNVYKEHYGKSNISFNQRSKNIIQSLNQSKLPDVINLEMEEYTNPTLTGLGIDSNIYKLKSTSTPEGEIIEIKI